MKRRDFLGRTVASVFGMTLPGSALGAAGDAAAAPSPATPPASPPGTASPSANSAAVARLYEMGRRNIGVHDPSTIVRCKDEFWFFCTGNFIPSWRSKDLVNWTRGPNALAEPLPWWPDAVPGFNGASCWAPDCIQAGGRYLVFYSISAFGKNTSAIGLLSNPTLDPDDPAFKWTDEGMVIRSVAEDNYNCIDPAAVLDREGNLWLSFGSFWTGIKLVALDKSGKPAPGATLLAIASNPAHATATNEGRLEDPINASQIEAPFIYIHGDYYYLFVDWGLCCHGLASTYNIRVGRSGKIAGPYLDKEGKDLAGNGGTLFVGSEGPMIDTAMYPPARGRGNQPPPMVPAFVGPGHAGIIQVGDKFWFSCHYYDGTTPTGQSVLSIRPLTWDKDGWPVLGEHPAPAPVPASPLPQRGRRGGNANPPPVAPPPAAPAPPAPAVPATS